jgi:protein amnionless
MISKIIFLLAIYTLPCNMGQKIWKTGFSTDKAKLWSNNRLPCRGQTVVFPRNLNGLVSVHSKVIDFGDIMGQKGLIFPENGGLMFPEDSLADASPDAFDSAKDCEKVADKAIFKPLPNTPYYSVDSWINEPNMAVPHLERIPCQYDTAVFPAFDTFRADLNYADKIVTKGFEVQERENRQELLTLLGSQTGQFLFPNSEETEFAEGRCLDSDKCECQEEDLLTYMCDYIECSVPKCKDPIKLEGHCCQICGSVFSLALDGKDLDIGKFRDRLKKTIKASNFDQKDINYHVSVKTSSWQLIIVDVGEYNQKSVELMKYLQSNLLKNIYKGEFYRYRRQNLILIIF